MKISWQKNLLLGVGVKAGMGGGAPMPAKIKNI